MSSLAMEEMNRVVGSRWVTAVGHITPMAHLNALTELVQMKGAKTAIEVGSWVGESAIALHNGGANVTCVDHFKGNLHDCLSSVATAMGPDRIEAQFRKNVGNLLGREITLIKQASLEAAYWLPRQNADLIFLDASHEYQDVKADIQAWRPHLASDGWMCGHDHNDAFPGVVMAVAECFSDKRQFLFRDTNIWVVR